MDRVCQDHPENIQHTCFAHDELGGEKTLIVRARRGNTLLDFNCFEAAD